MKFTLKKPCDNCPFRTNVPGYLRGRRVWEIIRAITRLDQTFACHKTASYDDEGGGVESANSQHCAGAMIFLESHDRANQMMRIAERLRLYDRSGLDMTAPVFKSASAMARHHEDSEPGGG